MLAAAGWETWALRLSATWFTKVAPWTAVIYLTPNPINPPGFQPPPGGWRASHIVAVLVDGAADYLDIRSDDGAQGGRSLSGHLPIQAEGLAVPIAGLPKLFVSVTGPAASDVHLLLARRAPSPSEC